MVGSRHIFGYGSAVLLASAALTSGAKAQSPNWTFWYLGGHAGYDWTNIDVQGVGKIKTDGFAGGILGGVNFYQSGNFVAGVEADVTWLNGNGSASRQFPLPEGSLKFVCGNFPASTTVSADVNWKATLRGRAGYLINPATLVYATAGAAWADVDLTKIGLDGENCTTRSSASATFFGGVFGGGTEMQLGANLYGRVEVLHYVFGDETVKFDGISTKLDLDETIARVGLTLRLN